MLSPLFSQLSSKEPILIAGPCSAESETQLLHTANQLREEIGLKLFRAGVWKPRTSPGGFEGYGEKALRWLKKVKEETGMLVGTEVGTSTQAKQTAEYGLDFVWIGARTTGSPFAVAEISEALIGVDMAILVKNPLAPDIELWAGAITRLLNSGHTRIGAILRGFYVGGEMALRNIPFWNLMEKFRELTVPGLPILCDASHIAGDKRYITAVMKEAEKRDFNGYIIESHCTPQEALTDKKQQLKPDELSAILQSMNSFSSVEQEGMPLELQRMRQLLDKLDDQILLLLRERFRMTDEIGDWKAFHHQPAHAEEREQELYKSRSALADLYNISGKFARDLYHLIHAESVRRQIKKTGK